MSSAFKTKTVTPVAVNLAPGCAKAGPVTTGPGKSAHFTDASSDPDGNGTATVVVNWGDGSQLSMLAPGSTFDHTYMTNGTFTITHKVKDSGGMKDVCPSTSVTFSKGTGVVMGSLTIDANGSTSTGLKGSYMLKQNGLTVKSGSVTIGTDKVVSTPTGNYQAYFYFATGVTCDFVNGTTVTVDGTVPISCN
jgi:hypothetical protein